MFKECPSMEQLKLDSVKVLDCMKLSHSLSMLWLNVLVPIISGLWITNVLQYGAKYISRKKTYFENNLCNSFILLHLHKAEIRRMGGILEKNMVLKIAFLLIFQVKKKKKKKNICTALLKTNFFTGISQWL